MLVFCGSQVKRLSSFRRAAFPPPVHRPEGIVFRGLLCIRDGNQPDWPLSQHHRHAHPLQRIWRHVQHALHHPIQPDSQVPAGRRGTKLAEEMFFFMVERIQTHQGVEESGRMAWSHRSTCDEQE